MTYPWNVTLRNFRETDARKLDIPFSPYGINQHPGYIVIQDQGLKDEQVILVVGGQGHVIYQNGTDGVADIIRGVKLLIRALQKGTFNRDIKQQEVR